MFFLQYCIFCITLIASEKLNAMDQFEVAEDELSNSVIYIDSKYIYFNLNHIHLTIPRDKPHLDFSNFNISPCQMIEVARSFSYFPNLKVLNLGFNNIKNKGVNILSSNFKYFSELKECYLQDNQIGDLGAEALSLNLKDLPKLSILGLESNYLKTRGVKALCENLKNFDLYLDSNQIDCDGIVFLEKIQKKISCLVLFANQRQPFYKYLRSVSLG
jgi:hypothetical protein